MYIAKKVVPMLVFILKPVIFRSFGSEECGMRKHQAEGESPLLFKMFPDSGKIGFLIEPGEKMLEHTACFKNQSK
jgi:hypothetical protein